MQRYFIILLAVLFFSWMGGVRIVHSAELTLGSISNEYKNEYETWALFVNYLSEQLRPHGIQKGRIVVKPSIDQMAKAILKKEVDLYIDSPFPILAVQKKAGTKILLRRWKKGKKEYVSNIFVRKDSKIETLGDLRGKTFVFEDDFSTSGYFLPKMALLDAGMNFYKLNRVTDPLKKNKVNYVFSLDEETSIYWVLEKKIHAGALNPEDFERYAKNRISELKIIHMSKPLPRHLVSYRKDLDPKLVKAIEKILLDMDTTKEGKEVLLRTEKTTKFDRVPQDVQKTYEELSRKFKRFQKSE